MSSTSVLNMLGYHLASCTQLFLLHVHQAAEQPCPDSLRISLVIRGRVLGNADYQWGKRLLALEPGLRSIE